MHAEEIIGPNLGSLKGKTTRKTLENETINSCDLPDGMLAEHGNVTLAVDIMYIDVVPFIMIMGYTHPRC